MPARSFIHSYHKTPGPRCDDSNGGSVRTSCAHPSFLRDAVLFRFKPMSELWTVLHSRSLITKTGYVDILVHIHRPARAGCFISCLPVHMPN